MILRILYPRGALMVVQLPRANEPLLDDALENMHAPILETARGVKSLHRDPYSGRRFRRTLAGAYVALGDDDRFAKTHHLAAPFGFASFEALRSCAAHDAAWVKRHRLRVLDRCPTNRDHPTTHSWLLSCGHRVEFYWSGMISQGLTGWCPWCWVKSPPSNYKPVPHVEWPDPWAA